MSINQRQPIDIVRENFVLAEQTRDQVHAEHLARYPHLIAKSKQYPIPKPKPEPGFGYVAWMEHEWQLSEHLADEYAWRRDLHRIAHPRPELSFSDIMQPLYALTPEELELGFAQYTNLAVAAWKAYHRAFRDWRIALEKLAQERADQKLRDDISTYNAQVDAKRTARG